ncbi:MAG: serine/threonine-protein kinase, partial [Candidatus Eremiobacterota bacterium]
MRLTPGSVVDGRYRIRRTVRAGGFGAIYEAHDERLPDAPCAIKEMLAEHTGEGANAELVRRKFEEEVRFLSTLHHSGIPRVRDFFINGEVCYIVMDFIRGLDLEEELRTHLELEQRPFPPETAVADAIAVLEVLEYLHSHNPPVIHRDVKPANLIRDDTSGKVRLVDFGLARNVKPGARSTQTTAGTMSYCPLEQLQGKADARSDVYAVGATLYHLLTGREPEVLAVGPVENVDPTLAEIVARAVESKPEHRFATAREMREALEQWLQGRRGQVTTPAPTVLSDTPTSSRPPSIVIEADPGALRWAIVVLVVALIGGVAVLNYLLNREPSRTPPATASVTTPAPVAVQTTPPPAVAPAPVPSTQPAPPGPKPRPSAAPAPAPTRKPVAATSPKPKPPSYPTYPKGQP